jgi:hypothetical protein
VLQCKEHEIRLERLEQLQHDTYITIEGRLESLSLLIAEQNKAISQIMQKSESSLSATMDERVVRLETWRALLQDLVQQKEERKNKRPKLTIWGRRNL